MNTDMLKYLVELSDGKVDVINTNIFFPVSPEVHLHTTI